jgi:hypothetical protein
LSKVGLNGCEIVVVASLHPASISDGALAIHRKHCASIDFYRKLNPSPRVSSPRADCEPHPDPSKSRAKKPSSVAADYPQPMRCGTILTPRDTSHSKQTHILALINDINQRVFDAAKSQIPAQLEIDPRGRPIPNQQTTAKSLRAQEVPLY